MKLGCSSAAHDSAIRAGKLDLLEWLRVCAEDLDLDGVELIDAHFPTTDPLYLRDLKRRCAELGLTIASVAVTNDFGDPARRADDIHHVKRWCDAAAYLGAPVLRLHAGRVPERAAEADAGRIVGFFRKVLGERGPDRRRLWSDIAWALRECADYGADIGVMLALHNTDEPGSVTASAYLLSQIVRDVGSPSLRACPDAARFADRTGMDLAASQAVLAHATLREVRDDGSDAAIHWPEALRVLQQASYRGFVIVGYAGREEPSTAVARGVRYLRGALHLLGRRQLLQETAGDIDSQPEAEYVAVEEAATIVARAMRPS